MNPTDTGFIGTLRLVAFALGVAAAFVLLPPAYEATWPWLLANVLSGYGSGVLSWAPVFWKCVLAVLIYSLTRTMLYLAVSAGGLLLAFRLLTRRWRDER